jgi:ABC-type amino acid transport substrate-binding protein
MPVKAEGKLTVVTTGAVAPLSLFATDNKTLIGNEVDLAYAIGEPAAGRVPVLRRRFGLVAGPSVRPRRPDFRPQRRGSV